MLVVCHLEYSTQPPFIGLLYQFISPNNITEQVAGGYQYFGNARRLKVGYLSMSVNHRRPLLETRRLLDQRPAPYGSTNDVNSEDPPPGNTESLQAVTPRIDLWWILVGIWMGSMLSSFDGMYHSISLDRHV